MITIDITKPMKAPVFVYYELTNFYQNHRRYVKSRDDDQLVNGNSIKTYSEAYSGNCDPYVYSTYTGIDGTTITHRQLYPCGLVALSAFNDTFIVSHQAAKTPENTPFEFLAMDESPSTISWSQDVEKKFHQANPIAPGNDSIPLIKQVDMWVLKTFPPQICVPVKSSISPRHFDVKTITQPDGMKIVDCDFTSNSPTCVFDPPCEGDFHAISNPADWGINNSHFINWMRTAGLSTFRKLYGRIDKDLNAGDKIQVGIQSNFPVDQYSGTKAVVLSTVSWLGGKNSFLGIGYIVVGCLALLFTAIYTYLHLKRPRRLVDIDYLDWGDHQ